MSEDIGEVVGWLVVDAQHLNAVGGLTYTVYSAVYVVFVSFT